MGIGSSDFCHVFLTSLTLHKFQEASSKKMTGLFLINRATTRCTKAFYSKRRRSDPSNCARGVNLQRCQRIPCRRYHRRSLSQEMGKSNRSWIIWRRCRREKKRSSWRLVVKYCSTSGGRGIGYRTARGTDSLLPCSWKRSTIYLQVYGINPVLRAISHHLIQIWPKSAKLPYRRSTTWAFWWSGIVRLMRFSTRIFLFTFWTFSGGPRNAVKAARLVGSRT